MSTHLRRGRRLNRSVRRAYAIRASSSGRRRKPNPLCWSAASVYSQCMSVHRPTNYASRIVPDSKSEDEHCNATRASLNRLAEEWAYTVRALNLGPRPTWSEIAKSVSVDRGTAQRLVVMTRNIQSGVSVESHDIPGFAAWSKVLSGLDNALGTEHPAYQRLAAACESFETALLPYGGSKAAALRAIAERRQSLTNVQRDGVAAANAVRLGLVRNCAEAIGYCVKWRLNLQIARPNPHHAERLDVAMVNVFLGCTGRPGAMPLALDRFGIGTGSEVEQSSGQHRAFVLTSVTSNPPPAILTVADDTHQTAFIEPTWTERSIDVGILTQKLAGLPSPIAPANAAERLLFSMVNRHPTEHLVLQTLLHPELAEGRAVWSGAYRGPPSGDRPGQWFDKLPEPLSLVKSESWRACVGRGDGIGDGMPLQRIIEEVEKRLQWGLDTYPHTSSVYSNPFPFASYSTIFEPREL